MFVHTCENEIIVELYHISDKKLPLSNKEIFVYVARATTDQQNVIWKTRTHRKCKKERPNRMSIVIARLSLQEKVILRKYRKRKVHSIYNL